MWKEKFSFIGTFLLSSGLCWSGTTHEQSLKPTIAVASNQWMWPNQTVPYKYLFDDQAFTNIMERAMRTIESQTCIRFVPCGGRSINECLLIYNTDDFVCQSTVGRQHPKKSFMVVNSRECRLQGLLQHELLHTLGFQHEHSRPDRDSFVIINWQNVRDNAVQNFEKYPWTSFPVSTPYDYGSIMHYGQYSFSKYSGRRSMTTFKEAGRLIGQRARFSRWDIAKVNKLYQCPEKEENVCKDDLPKKSCMHEGLVKRKCKNKEWATKNCMKTCDLCWPHTNATNACKDYSIICPYWAKKGLCDKDKRSELRSKHLIPQWCAKSCNTCGKP